MDLPRGGSFLTEQTKAGDVFTPEDFTEEHRMIFRTAAGFVADNVMTRIEELEAREEGLARELLVAAGALGLNGADIPEEYDGMEMDKISSTIIAECMGRVGSWAVMHGGQTGIGSMPVVMFGNHQQKKKYLPGIVSGEKIGAYALTEPEAGSDALAARTRAVLSPDGRHWVLNGTKQFITNSAVADLFVVYAKVDGDKFTAFIMDKDAPGLTLGPEEKKMGLMGSSTRSLILEDVKIPVENLLFEIGRGHVVAFNILNLGRYKLAANALGNAKYALELAATYAGGRKQFNTSIANFGLVGEKLAEAAVRIYAAESMVYRTGGLLDNILAGADTSGEDGGRVAAGCIEEYAVECSIAKVFATEVMGYAADEGVQVHGGYGYSSEYPIERVYRDARVFRIFEGTNEINRMLIPVTLLRRASRGNLPLWDAVAGLREKTGVGERDGEAALVQAGKDVFLLTLGAARQKHGDGLPRQQEILGRLADLAIGAFAMESAWLRARKAADRDGAKKARLKLAMARTCIYTTIASMHKTAQEALAALAQGEEPGGLAAGLADLIRYKPADTIGLRREIAAAVAAAGRYVV